MIVFWGKERTPILACNSKSSGTISPGLLPLLDHCLQEADITTVVICASLGMAM